MAVTFLSNIFKLLVLFNSLKPKNIHFAVILKREKQHVFTRFNTNN